MAPVHHLLAAIEAIGRGPGRFVMACGIVMVAALLALGGSGLMLAALHQALQEVVDPPLATLFTALACFFLVALLLLIAWRMLAPPPPAPLAPPGERRGAVPADAAAAAESLIAWTQHHPREAALTAAILGFCAGGMPEMRRAFASLIAGDQRRPPDRP